MGFDRKLERKAILRARKMTYIPVLNYPGKKLEVPQQFKRELLRQYDLTESDLVGKTPFHAIFVVEGLAFAMISRASKILPIEHGGVNLTLHLVDLGEEANRHVVGADICGMWESLTEVLTYAELEARYKEFAGGLS